MTAPLSARARMAHVLSGAAGASLVVRHAVTALARHSGVPAVVVAALALVLVYRLARRAAHLVVEIALALALVLAATRAGWLRF